MRKLALFVILLAAAYLAAMAANPPRAEYDAYLQQALQRGEALHPIWVNSNGWHTGIIIERTLIPPGLLPEKDDFPQASYLEIGWGDAGFYQADDITGSIALRALFGRSPSVVHIVGFTPAPAQYFPHSRLIRLEVTSSGLLHLLEAIHVSIDRHPAAQKRLSRQNGLYGDSRFYAATGSYSALHSCNHWTAHRLRHAGIPITPWYAATSSSLMWQLQRYAASGG